MPIAWSLVSELTTLGALAYDDSSLTISEKLQGTGWRYVTPAELGMAASAFEPRGYFNGAVGASAYVAFDGSRVAIVFRGTEGFLSLDTLSDIQILLGDLPQQVGQFQDLIDGVRIS